MLSHVSCGSFRCWSSVIMMTGLPVKTPWGRGDFNANNIKSSPVLALFFSSVSCMHMLRSKNCTVYKLSYLPLYCCHSRSFLCLYRMESARQRADSVSYLRLNKNKAEQLREIASVLDMAMLTVVAVDSGAEERDSHKCQEKYKHLIAS